MEKIVLKKDKIYVAGCGGMLGEAFYRNFKKDYNIKCTDIDVNEEWLNFLDFRNADEYENDVKSFESDWLFHLGALFQPLLLLLLKD